MHRKTQVRIDTSAIRRNFAVACNLAPSSRNIAVIKADAYGHGITQVANAIQDIAPVFAVAIVDEALELREHNIQRPILVLQGATTARSYRAAAENALSLMIHCDSQIRLLKESRVQSPIDFSVKLNTGMNRLGFMQEELAQVVTTIQSMGHKVAMLCTHLACADDPDNAATKGQIASFRRIAATLGLPLSIANSAGIIAWAKSHAHWNRPGYMLYGNSPLKRQSFVGPHLAAAMTFGSEIIGLLDVRAGQTVGYNGRWTAQRNARIATVAAGYADGYPRHAIDGTPVYINGHRMPLAGVVSMDMLTVDVTDLPNAKVGDHVELWGCHIPVNDVAAASSTIGYELLTGVSARVPRVYG